MILRYGHLQRHPAVVQAMTGLRVAEFDELVDDVLPAFGQAEAARLSQPRAARPARQRASGAGHPFALDVRDQILLPVVWLRVYPTHPVLGYLFGVSRGTVDRTLPRVLPVLAAAGQESMRQALAALAEPTRRRRRHLDAVRRDTPEWAVVIDRSAHRVQRPQGATAAGARAADDYCSGETQQHTLTTQVAVDEETGRSVDLPESVPGPTSAIQPRERPDLLRRLPRPWAGSGTKPPAGATSGCPAGAWPRRAARRAGGHAPRRTGPPLPPSPGAAPASSPASAGGAGSSRSRSWIATIVRPTPAVAAPPPAWSIGRCGVATPAEGERGQSVSCTWGARGKGDHCHIPKSVC